MNHEKIEVLFPQTGEVVKAVEIKPTKIKNGDTCLVDRFHNANVVLRVAKEQILPKGPWEVRK